MNTEVILIDPAKLKLLEVNARYMRHEVFSRLTENIKRDKGLTSVPFCAIYQYYQVGDDIPLDADGEPVFEVLSGNHRVMAAIEAGVSEIQVMVTRDPLTKDQRRAIQLSHNEITGEDDPSILKLIYSSIENVDWKMYSGLDDKKLQLLEDVKPGGLSEANLDFQTISMVFLPDEIERVKEVWDLTKKSLAGSKGAWLASWAQYDEFMDTLDDTSRAHGIKNVATALLVVLEIFTRHIDDLTEGFLDHDGGPKKTGGMHVPIRSVLGTHHFPAATVAATRKLAEILISKGVVSSDKRYEALDWAVQRAIEAAKQL